MTEKKKSVKTVTKADEGEEAKSRPRKVDRAVIAKKPPGLRDNEAGRRRSRGPRSTNRPLEKRETQEGGLHRPQRSLVSAFSLAEGQPPRGAVATIARIAAEA